MIERLYFVAETLWAWTVNGFGGLGSSNPHPNPSPTRSQSRTLPLTPTLTPPLSLSRRAGQLQHGDAGARDALSLGPASGARPPAPRHMPRLPEPRPHNSTLTPQPRPSPHPSTSTSP
jgi:hypothetical protein